MNLKDNLGELLIIISIILFLNSSGVINDSIYILYLLLIGVILQLISFITNTKKPSKFPSNFILGLTGVDGSGKTTIAKMITKNLREKELDCRYFHEFDFIFLKHLFNITERLSKKRANNIKKNIFLSTHNLTNGNGKKSMILTMYYFLFWVDKLMSYVYFRVSAGIKICDRWPHDIIAHFQLTKYNNIFIRILFDIYPKPDLMFVLTVPSHVALVRKKNDLSHKQDDINFYRNLHSHLTDLNTRYGYDNVIDSNRPRDEVLTDIITGIKTFRDNNLMNNP